MSTQHTPGRLSYKEGGDANIYTLHADGDWLMYLLHNGRPMPEKQRENMRRLVACWNACMVIPIEALEAYPAIAPNGLKAIRHVEAQRDELLAALKELAALDFGALVTTDDDERRIDLVAMRARAAIQKAEGK